MAAERLRRGNYYCSRLGLHLSWVADLGDWCRTADRRAGTRKTMIVALARKLLIALWRFVTTGETMEGFVLRPAG